MSIWNGGGLGLPTGPITQKDVAAALGLARINSGPSLAKPKVKFAKPGFVPTGSITATPRTVGGSIEGGIAGLLGNFMDEKRAAQLGSRFMAPLNDVTPVGNVTGAEEGGTEFYNGLTHGDLRRMALGAASFGLSVMPGPTGKVGKKALKGMFGNMMRDTSGAIRAWHGSPHDFDRFDMSKIGTGEGAQAYGHGLYFAENKDVAQQYQNILSNRSKATDDPASAAGFWLGMNNGDREAAIKTFENMKAQNQRILDRVHQRLPVAPGAAGHALSEIKAADEALAHLAAGTEAKSGGRLYEVNINAEPGDFLDWDAPLAKQPRAMEALNAIDLNNTGALSRTKTMLDWARQGTEQPHNRAIGRDLLNAVSDYGAMRSAERDALMPYGIQGVRYLDQGSRGAGNGSRNFVVFDDKLVDILGKY